MARDDSSPSTSSSRTSRPLSRLGKEINELRTQSLELAAEKALMAFLRPPRMHLDPHQRSLLNTAERSTVQIDGIGIITYTWTKRADAPTVLLGHGYGTSAAIWLNFVQPLLDAGLRVVACDQAGHGESEGDWGNTRIFINTLQALALRYHPLAAIIGHSVGASMALIALADHLLVECPRLVCLNPPTHMDAVLRRFLQGIGCSADLSPLMQQIMDDKGIVSPGQVRHLQLSPKIQERILFVLDRDDKLVDATDAEYITTALVHSTLEMTRGLGHFGGVKDANVVRMVMDFVIEGPVSPSLGSSKL